MTGNNKNDHIPNQSQSNINPNQTGPRIQYIALSTCHWSSQCRQFGHIKDVFNSGAPLYIMPYWNWGRSQCKLTLDTTRRCLYIFWVTTSGMMNATTIISALILTIYITSFNNVTDARNICTPCENFLECEEPPNRKCVWGETRDFCDRRTCAKGPGERCGGPFDVLGRCGEGMMCLHEKCHGCSTLTIIDCYP